MNLKKSPFAIQDKKTRYPYDSKDFPTIADLMRAQKVSNQDKKTRDPYNSKDYPTIADLMREQKVPKKYAKTVHHRRDLDSLG